MYRSGANCAPLASHQCVQSHAANAGTHDTLTRRRLLEQAFSRGAVLAVSDVASQFEAEGLTLLVADNKAGYCGVHLDKPGKPKPYLARVWRGGKIVNLGSFATAEEAALCVARSPEGQEAAKRAAEAQAPLTSEEVRQQAQAEGLALFKADNTTGYFGVPPQARQAQALPGTGVARRQAGEPGLLRHRQGGGAVRRTVAGGVGGGAGGSGEGGAGVAATGERGGPGHGPRHAARRRPQGGGRGPAHAARRLRQGGAGGPAHAAGRLLQGGGRRAAHAIRYGCEAGARGRCQAGALAGRTSQAAEKEMKCHKGNAAAGVESR